MEEQVNRLVDKVWGKTTLASTLSTRLNSLHKTESPACASTPIAAFIPLDGYHLSRAQLSALPDPTTAHARRGAAFTFDAAAYLSLVRSLRAPILPETKTIYAPSFDHAVKDPLADDIPIVPSVKVCVFEGNYVALDEAQWKEAGELMDEIWFVHVEDAVARQRLVARHVKAGICRDEEEAGRRADENDLVNGRQITNGVWRVDEKIVSREDENWRPEAQGV
ncbi:MAG: hypothetical protein Q9191_000128 [Dirinaria sp. TL-2023a]